MLGETVLAFEFLVHWECEEGWHVHLTGRKQRKSVVQIFRGRDMRQRRFWVLASSYGTLGHEP